MKIVWSRRAIRHLEALRDFIARDNPKAAERVARQILESVELLANQPQIGRPGRLVGTRELVIAETAYVMPYRVRGERVEVIAVFHGRQKWPVKL
jgi:toxin ParE1/3/4